MDDPVSEIRDVVRSLTEPYEASKIAESVDKYFTEDAFILHPLLNQPRSRNSREGLKGIYKMLRVFSIENKIEFHAVMFNEDKTQGAIELTEHMYSRILPLKSLRMSLRLIVRLDLIKGKDGKYRIWRQHDNLPSDIGMIGVSVIPGIATISNLIKAFNGISTGFIGRFLLSRGWLGP